MCPLLDSGLSGSVPCASGVKSLIRTKLTATPKARASYSMLIGRFRDQLRVTISPKTKNWDHQKIVFHSLALNVYVVWHQSCNVNGLFGLSNKTTSPNESANYWPCSQPLRSKMVILSKVIATGASWVVLLHFNVSLEIRTKSCPKMKVSKTLIATANVVILAVS